MKLEKQVDLLEQISEIKDLVLDERGEQLDNTRQICNDTLNQIKEMRSFNYRGF